MLELESAYPQREPSSEELENRHACISHVAEGLDIVRGLQATVGELPTAGKGTLAHLSNIALVDATWEHFFQTPRQHARDQRRVIENHDNFIVVTSEAVFSATKTEGPYAFDRETLNRIRSGRFPASYDVLRQWSQFDVVPLWFDKSLERPGYHSGSEFCVIVDIDPLYMNLQRDHEEFNIMDRTVGNIGRPKKPISGKAVLFHHKEQGMQAVVLPVVEENLSTFLHEDDTYTQGIACVVPV